MAITKSGKLSTDEALRSLRDTALVALSAGVVSILEIAEVTDFGEYQVLAMAILAGVKIFANRLFNVARV